MCVNVSRVLINILCSIVISRERDQPLESGLFLGSVPLKRGTSSVLSPGKGTTEPERRDYRSSLSREYILFLNPLK